MEILIFIVIIVVSMFARNAKAKSNVDGKGDTKQGMPPFNQGNYSRKTMGGNQPSGNASVPTNTIRPPYSTAKSTTDTIATKTSASATYTKKVVEKREENESVTDFLANKAKKERLQQESDVRDQSKRNEKFQSGRTSAERLIYGDPVPNNKRKVVCKYCGAENLVPNYVANYYKCYFCREDI